MIDSINVEVTERQITEKRVIINGDEFDAGLVLDFLRELKDTNSFIGYLRWTGTYDEIADTLHHAGIVGKKNNGGWYEKNAAKREQLRNHIVSELYMENDDD